MPDNGKLRAGERRSAGAIPQRRVPQAWPADRRFRILSIDGGGIRGIFPAAVLAGLEQHHTGGRPIGEFFDLVAGTSTGGILGLGLGAGLTGRELLELYVDRGCEVFPPAARGIRGSIEGFWRNGWHYVRYRYDRTGLESLLNKRLGAERLLGSSKVRLVVPAFEGRHSEVFVFKTPHHPDYKSDRYQPMVAVALATAPAYYRPLEHGGYLLVDGGVWANNPVMLAVIEALTCFTVNPAQIDVLTIGCGDDPYFVSDWQIRLGGLFFWKDAIFAAMRLQSLAATNQARLLLGPPNVFRIDAPTNEQKIPLDDLAAVRCRTRSCWRSCCRGIWRQDRGALSHRCRRTLFSLPGTAVMGRVDARLAGGKDQAQTPAFTCAKVAAEVLLRLHSIRNSAARQTPDATSNHFSRKLVLRQRFSRGRIKIQDQGCS